MAGLNGSNSQTPHSLLDFWKWKFRYLHKTPPTLCFNKTALSMYIAAYLGLFWATKNLSHTSSDPSAWSPPCKPLLPLQWNLHVDHLQCHQFLYFLFFSILLLSFTVSTSPLASITLISFLNQIFLYWFIFLLIFVFCIHISLINRFWLYLSITFPASFFNSIIPYFIPKFTSTYQSS